MPEKVKLEMETTFEEFVFAKRVLLSLQVNEGRVQPFLLIPCTGAITVFEHFHNLTSYWELKLTLSACMFELSHTLIDVK